MQKQEQSRKPLGNSETSSNIESETKKTYCFCSIIIPTVGRSSLDKAVASVINQQFIAEANFEIIIVNDSGKPLSAAGWQNSKRVSIINTYKRERSVARNAGASLSKGKYLLFLDDDDWIAPNALQNFWESARNSNADWLYGASQLVDRQYTPLIELKHNLKGNAFLPAMAGEWIPLQASLIKSEVFFAAGGFNPRLAGPEDIDLLRRITLDKEIAEVPALVAYIVMGETGSTTDYNNHHIASRWARENILDTPRTYQRLKDKANNNYWHGRLSRIYLTSTVWNLRNRRLTTALSRAISTLRSLFLAKSSLFSAGYWAAVAKPYQSSTFARGIEEANRLASP
jgi:glycosyltransferase involved in cell wall biosynthesis